ncbi:MAG TPA: hypothetical protein VF241_07255 [Propionibacteriaceae bacterium]
MQDQPRPPWWAADWGADRVRTGELPSFVAHGCAKAEIGYPLALRPATIKTNPRIRRRGKALEPGGGT